MREFILGKIRIGGIRTFQKTEKKTLQIPGKKNVPGTFKVFFKVWKGSFKTYLICKKKGILRMYKNIVNLLEKNATKC